jgi:PadR family transcriptional regulator PadR
MRVDRRPRCRCRVGPGHFEVRARIERFAEPAVLLLLAEGPSHGYQLAEALEDLLDEGRVDFGNLYRLLRALEEEGLVASTWSEGAPGPQKRVYRLTGDGIALLGAWAASLRSRSARITTLLERYASVEERIHPRAGEIAREDDQRKYHEEEGEQPR